MKRLGQLLLEQGWVSPERLLRALNHQKLVGGRLGTCLLEMEAVEERLLLRALSLQLSVPAADVEDLRGIPDEVIVLLPAKVARRCQAMPFRLLGGQLSIALLGVRDLAVQDELSFVSGKRLRVHIANEARIFESLEKYYGEECPQRFTQLLDRVNRARYLWDRAPREAPPVGRAPASGDPWELPPLKSPSAPVRQPPPEKSAVAQPPVESEEELIGSPAPLLPASTAAPEHLSASSRVPEAPTAAPRSPASTALAQEGASGDLELPIPPDEPGPTAARATPPGAGSISLSEVEHRLNDSAERDDVGRILLEYLIPRFARVVLLALKKDEVRGWMGHGEGIDQERLGRLRVALAAPSIFSTLRDGGATFRGQVPPLPAHRELAGVWGGSLPADSMLFAIPVRGRAAAVIYVDRAPQPIEVLDLDGMHRLVALAGAALEACIRRQKQRKA